MRLGSSPKLRIIFLLILVLSPSLCRLACASELKSNPHSCCPPINAKTSKGKSTATEKQCCKSWAINRVETDNTAKSLVQNLDTPPYLKNDLHIKRAENIFVLALFQTQVFESSSNIPILPLGANAPPLA